MKTSTLKFTIYSVAIIFVLSFTSCSNSNKQTNTNEQTTKTEAVEHEHNHEASKENVKYQCPMKCEDDKTYDKKGKCPVCGMDLKEIEDA